MPLDFPNNPTPGQVFTAGSNSWLFDGAKWTGPANPGTAFLPLSGGTMSGPLLITATGGTTPRSVQDRFADVVDVMDYGAVGDGNANDTAAFNAALTFAGTNKQRTVVVPTGLYKLDPITIPTGVVLKGTVLGPIDPQPGFLTNAYGATLLINSHATAFITLGRSSGLEDVLIYDPGQVAPTATAPNVFPAQVLMAQPSRVRGVTLVNAYVGVQVYSGRCFVEDCYIGAYNIGVQVDTSADVTYFNNVWCGVFYDTAVGLFPWQNMDRWVMTNNGIAFWFGRADAVSMTNCGSFIKWASIYMVAGTGSPSGPSYGWCSNFNADLCMYGVVANSTNSVGWNFANATFLPSTPTYQAVAPFYLPTAGANPVPVITWNGGSNTFPSSWTYPRGLINSGRFIVRGVDQVPDFTRLGVTDGSDAAAGMLGEFLSAANTSGVPLSSTTAANVATLSLTAGDWEVSGEVWILPSGSLTHAEAAISLASATLPATPAPNTSRVIMSEAITGAVSAALTTIRQSLTTTTTIYLLGMAAFASGSCSAQGVISARRVR